MARMLTGAVGSFVVLGAIVLCLSAAVPAVFASSFTRCPKGFVNFGDSLTDTGNAVTLRPFTSQPDPDFAPYGETFFGRPAQRFSDGRVVPDFFSLAFGYPLLDGYFKSTTFDYRHGINLAEGGATAAVEATAVNQLEVYPTQVNQFRRFLLSATAAVKDRECSKFVKYLPKEKSYLKNWLYTIEAGGGDLLNALQNNATVSDLVGTIIPKAIQGIANTTEALYSIGGRNFLIFGVPAEGCSTVILTLASTQPKDSLGCVASVNQLAQAINAGLVQAIQALRAKFPDANIAYFDYYGANIEILTNPASYGFSPNLTQTACCGVPDLGPLNFSPFRLCGSAGYNVCTDPSKYVIWDGIHFTDAFYSVISKFALAANFTDGGINYAAYCDLDFSNFGPSATYYDVFPSACDSTFY